MTQQGNLVHRVDAQNHSATFDLQAIAKDFPDGAATMLLDKRLTDEPSASVRVFRVYKPVPAHYHQTCDEYLQVIEGRAQFTVGDNAPIELGPGQLVFFKRNVVHSIPAIVDEPLVFLAIDTPRRDPGDVIFVDPATGDTDTFIRTISPSASRY